MMKTQRTKTKISSAILHAMLSLSMLAAPAAWGAGAIVFASSGNWSGTKGQNRATKQFVTHESQPFSAYISLNQVDHATASALAERKCTDAGNTLANCRTPLRIGGGQCFAVYVKQTYINPTGQQRFRPSTAEYRLYLNQQGSTTQEAKDKARNACWADDNPSGRCTHVLIKGCDYVGASAPANLANSCSLNNNGYCEDRQYAGVQSSVCDAGTDEADCNTNNGDGYVDSSYGSYSVQTLRSSIPNYAANATAYIDDTSVASSGSGNTPAYIGGGIGLGLLAFAMNSDGAGFFSPIAAVNSNGQYAIGGRHEWTLNNWSSHVQFTHAKTANGEIDFSFDNGLQYTADPWQMSFVNIGTQKETRTELSLLATKQFGAWKWSPFYRLSHEITPADELLTHDLKLQGIWKISRWTMRPSIGFSSNSLKTLRENGDAHVHLQWTF